ncbi:MAG: hypothetical protein LQ340_002679 [Diploschistes diacapsis]|nr:MAG: hypothetical protein LQ340_002679 [Diploschistes diacapsis]
MFSYLRPTGRRVPSIQADQATPNETIEEEQPLRRVSSGSSLDEEFVYRPIVSPTAPVLPPIPRVASIYGGPRNLASIDEHENSRNKRLAGKPQEDDLKRAELAARPTNDISSAEKLSLNFEYVMARSRAPGNFSLPFQSTVTSSDASPQRSRPLHAPCDSVSATSHQFSTSGGSRQQAALQKDRDSKSPQIPQRTQIDSQHILRPSDGLRATTRRESSEQSSKLQGIRAQVETSSMISTEMIATASDATMQEMRPLIPRTAQNHTRISGLGPGRSDLLQQKSLQNMRSEVNTENQQAQSQQRPSQLNPLSNVSEAPQRSSKLMLTRFNPMSLLARRRSSQPASEVDNDAYRRNVMLGNNLPENYDPRIRGNKVHDFSTPRTRQPLPPLDLSSLGPRKRNDGGASSDQQANLSAQGRTNAFVSEPSGGGERQHAPVFREHFGDEIATWRFDDKDRRNQSTTGILDRLPLDASEESRSSLPPFAQKFPETVTDPFLLSDPTFAVAPRPALQQRRSSSSAASSTEPSSAESSPVEPSPLAEPSPLPVPCMPSRSSPTSPPKSRSRTPSAHYSAAALGESSKHSQSTSSRFSFDMSGVGSAMQEKLLEDKHRQKNARKRRTSRASRISAAVTDDDFDSDNVDFDDGIEEEIPGVNANDDEYPFSGFVANFTLAGPSLYNDTHGKLGQSVNNQAAGQMYTHANTTLHASMTANADNHLTQEHSAALRGASHISISEHDDLYFDDGMIEDVDLQDGPTLDESIFDDENSRIYERPLRDLELEPPSAAPDAESSDNSSQQSTRPISLQSSLAAGHNVAATADTSRTSVQPPEKSIAARRGSALKQDLALGFDQAVGLTTDNLAAYHDALALATQKAAQEGRFDRKMSTGEPANFDAFHNGASHVTFDDQLGLEMPDNSGLDDYSQDEDDIIAAANASALENDDEGFYGREFGFYARANGSSEVEFVNGGYFGPAGMGDIRRSHSGRVNGQEPSLTPITERSEWSQRNSIISLALHSGHGSFPAAVQTPGLAQIADEMQYEEHDSSMSLSALMKLRQSAWGGSSTSVHSMGGGGGSVKSTSPPKSNPAIPPPPRPLAPQAPQLPSPSQLEPESSKHRSSKPPNILAKDLLMSPLFPPPSLSAGADSKTATTTAASPMRRNNAIKGYGHSSPIKTHSRNSSGADSVAYIKEKDEEGSRWVMERRRMGEGGLVEVLGREVVEGGRI